MIAPLLLTALLLGQPSAAPPQAIAEIRVHGNATITDARVIELAGVAVGDPLTDATEHDIEQRLRESGRFDEVQVRKEYRTLAMDRPSLVLIVHERPGVTAAGVPPSPWRTLRSKLMFLPIIDYEDGYGLTYGGRTTVISPSGAGERVSVPLSWGAERRAAVEVSRTFSSGPFTTVLASYGIDRRENPFFHEADRRVELRGRVERRLFSSVTLGGEATRGHVTFGGAREPIWTAGADVALDTRRDPAYPIDAVYALAGWDRLHRTPAPSTGSGSGGAGGRATIDRSRFDVRGYKRVFGKVVAAGRVLYDTSSGPRPAYDEPLLGGVYLRGLRAGSFAGDTRLAWSGELRVPLTSPLNIARFGVNAFFDAGKVAPHGTPLSDVSLERGAGAGVWLTATVIRLNLAIARAIDQRSTRVVFETGFTF